MNAGLSNLATLKAWLLPAAMVAGTDFDGQIAAIGKGVAGQLESYCNRQFVRTAGDVFECTADREHLALPRYPVETITTLEMQYSLADGWQAQTPLTDIIWNQALDRGLLYFGFRQAITPLWRMRITYTGGYFFEQLEPADNGFPTAVPAGSTAVPANLFLAWQLQCEHIWTQRDKLGLAIGHDVHASNARVVPALAQIQLLPQVTDLARSFIRYSLT